jgi:hypothetical protein
VICHLKWATIGCFIEIFQLGALCYADDLAILAPTAYAMRAMVNISDEYASEQENSFNANKSKRILFKPHHGTSMYDTPSFYTGNKLIDYTQTWPHLGTLISESGRNTISGLYCGQTFSGETGGHGEQIDCDNHYSRSGKNKVDKNNFFLNNGLHPCVNLTTSEL